VAAQRIDQHSSVWINSTALVYVDGTVVICRVSNKCERPFQIFRRHDLSYFLELVLAGQAVVLLDEP